MPRPRRFTALPDAELARCAAPGSGFLVLFAARAGTRERMPVVPVDARKPAIRAPLLRAVVTDVDLKSRRIRIADDHDVGGWVAIDDGLYALDIL